MSNENYRDDVFDLPFTRTISTFGRLAMNQNGVTFVDVLNRTWKMSPAEALAFFQSLDDYRDQLVKTLPGEKFDELEETAQLLIKEYQ